MATARGRWHCGPMRVLSLVLVSVLLPARLAAQSPSATEPLPPRTRVRVSTVDAPSVFRIGLVSAASVDTLWYLPDGADTTVALSYSAIAQLNVSLARHRNARKGAVIGVLVGAGTGIILGLAGGDDQGWVGFTARQNAVIGGITVGALGLLIGGALGAAHDTEEWSPIRVLPRASLSPQPSFGVRVSMSIR